MWKCLKGRREHSSLSWNSPSTLMTVICLTVVVGMAHSAAVIAQLRNWSYRSNSLKEDLLVLRGFCYGSCFHKWGSTVHCACDLQQKKKKKRVMGRAYKKGSWSVISLVQKQDTDLGGEKATSLHMLVPQETWQQRVTVLGLLRCSVHHSAPATFLCTSALSGKVAESRRAPASTAHCFLNGTSSVWENS